MVHKVKLIISLFAHNKQNQTLNILKTNPTEYKDKHQTDDTDLMENTF